MDYEPVGHHRQKTVECAIALLISDEQANARLIALSELIAQERRPTSPQLVLNATIALPHVTLAMMTVDVERLSRLRSEVHMLEYPDYVRLNKQVIPYQINDPDAALWIGVDSDEAIEELHRKAMALRTAFHVESTNSISRCAWIDNFETHAFEHFHPHITVGRGSSTMEHSLSKVPVSLQLVALGEQCTVTGVL